MTASLVGRKVRLTGDGWSTDSFGRTYTVEVDDTQNDGTVGLTHEDGGRIWAWPFEKSVLGFDCVVLDEPGPTLGQHGIGFLDGLLGLPMQQGNDSYEQGYVRGENMRHKVGEL